MKRLILGYGEVGKGFESIIGDVAIHDPAKGYTFTGSVDVMHVTIPFNKEFVKNIEQYIDEFKPSLTIVHSTVPVGTMEKFSEPIAYSYVTGRHPHLGSEMKRFTKVIAATDAETFDRAFVELSDLGFTVLTKQIPFRDVELAKLADTTYYGICIAWHKSLLKMAQEYGVSSENLSQTNRMYNDGYRDIAPEFLRPELRFEEGKIGGHCVVPNAMLLQQDFPTNLLLKSIVEAE